MKQKRTIYSLLLTSFMLVFAFSYSMAQQVNVESKSSALRCVSDVLNIDVDNPSDIAAFEIILEVSSTSGGAYFDALSVTMDPGLSVLTNHVIDLSGVDNVSPDTVRIAGMLIDAGDACLLAGITTVANVSYTTNDVCSGTITISGATLNSPCGINPSTGFADCGTLACLPASVNDGVVTIVNSAPSIDAIADATVHWGDPYNSLATGSDNDAAGCENLSFSKVSGPAALSVASSGAISWSTTGPDVGTHVVEVAITDKCGAADTTSFSICVNNDAPTIACPAGVTNLVWGYEASGSVSGSDIDNGPSPLAYSVASFSGPGSVSIDPATGDWTWQTAEDNAYLGDFELCVAVTDGANLDAPCSVTNADTCCVSIHVIPTIRVTIEKTHGTLQGHNEIVSIDLDGYINPANEMGGYDLLVQYDASALSFTGATPGSLVSGCGWEYFTYRYGPSGNCGANACPSGKLRIVAIAETNNGENHPACYVGGTGLADLNFLVSNDRTLECQYVPIRFCWYDCGDNAFSSRSGDTLFISRHVYDFDNPNPIEMEDAFPTLFGANSSCDVALGDGKPDPLRLVDFWNGGIDIVCADSIDARGDINLNQIAYEIADAVLYSNYFVMGLSVFDVNLEGQIAASDVNADGLTLTVADLVYLIRVVVGDALPYPKEVTSASANYIHTSNGIMSVNNGVAIGAAYVVVEGNAVPQLLADDMEMKYNFDGTNTRILVYSIAGGSFSGDFLNVQGDLVSIEMATREGSPVNATLIPTEYSLKQNYPNPFNPKTTIVASMAEAGDYELSIYNVNGRKVASFSGQSSAGQFEIDWDASEMASGLYFYRLVTENFTDTKKMVLLK